MLRGYIFRSGGPLNTFWSEEEKGAKKRGDDGGGGLYIHRGGADILGACKEREKIKSDSL